MYITFLPFSAYISQVVQFNILIFYIVRFFTETKSAKQENDSGSDDDAPLSSYRQPGSNNRAPPPPGPTEAEYLARYLSHRNNQLKVDTNTDNTEQHSKTKGGDHKDIASSTKTDADFNTTSLLQQLNAEKKKREILLADRMIADTKYNALQKKLETDREEMELTKDEHRKMEAEWKKTLETSEAEKNALMAKMEAEKKTRQILEVQQNYQVSKLLLNDRMHVDSGPFHFVK